MTGKGCCLILNIHLQLEDIPIDKIILK